MTLYEDLDEALEKPKDVSELDLVGYDLVPESITLPDEISKMVNLKAIRMAIYTNIKISNEILKLTKLKKLELCEFFNTKLPMVIFKLKNLTDLTFRGADRKVTILPSQIGNLANLVSLDLQLSHFTYLPIELGKLTKLERLNLHCNEFTDLPEFLAKLPLKEIKIGLNCMNYFPDVLFKIKTLEKIHMRGGDLKFFKDKYPYNFKCIPDELGKLPNLNEIAIRGLDLSRDHIDAFKKKYPHITIDEDSL